jgi:dTDP-4-amino-4,6-dideoxygalactose transaminase
MTKVEIGTLKISEKAKKYVNDVLDNNRLSYGYYSQQFEKLFAEKHDCKFAIVTNSGTSALHVAIAALKIKNKWGDGDEIIVPATTFVATINTILHNNLKPVLVDVDSVYYEINEELIEEKITTKTRAIIPVHLFGLPCNVERISCIAKKYDLNIVEDSCECMLSSYKNKKVGSWGDIGCFSTYIAHLLTTGVGGICTTNDLELAVLIRSLNNHGRDSIYISIDDDDNKSEKDLNEIVSKRFSFVHLGHSFRLTEMEWAIGLAQLEDELENIIKTRCNNAFKLNSMFEDCDLTKFINIPKIRKHSTHSFMIYPITINENQFTDGVITKIQQNVIDDLTKTTRKNLINFLEQNDIETRDLLPVINQPVYKDMDFIKTNHFTNSHKLLSSGFYIGCHQGLSNQDLIYIVDKFKTFFGIK